MDSNIHVFTVWTHRSAKSIFGADSHPVIRNGELLCFPSEEHAQAECDRLNAASGGSHGADAGLMGITSQVTSIKEKSTKLTVLAGDRPTRARLIFDCVRSRTSPAIPRILLAGCGLALCHGHHAPSGSPGNQ